MKEQLIVLNRQMLYPEKREKIAMPDGTYTPEEQQISQQDLEKRAQEQLKKEEDKKARVGMWKYVKKEALKKRDSERAKEVDKEVKVAEDKEKAPRSGEKTPKKYFKEIPQPMQSSIDNFCRAAEWIDLSHLDTEFLTYHYLSLRQEAKEKRVDPKTFLSKIETELDARRQVNVGELTKESDEQINIAQRLNPVAGGSPELDLTGITDPQLQNVGQAINDQIQIIGENYDILNSRYDNVVALTGVDPGQKRRLLEQISLAMNRAKEDAIKKRHEEEENRERGSWYEERRITGKERTKMDEQLNKIIKGEAGAREDIDKLFNRMFDYADSNPLEEWDKVLGAAGLQEHHHWITMLNVLKGEAAGNTVKVDLINSLIQRYSNEYNLRKLLHNTYYIVETGGDPKNFVEYSSQFLSHYLDLVLSESPEVEVAYRIREQVLYQIKRENNGTIPPETVEFIAKEVDKKIRDPETGEEKTVRQVVFESDFEKRSVELFRKVMKTTKLFGEGGNIPDWRIDRALSVSRGLGMVLLRWPEIVAECTLQAPEEANESQPSIPWEKLSWELNPLDHKIKRYKIAREMRSILYAAVNRKKGLIDFWNQDELKQSTGFAAITALANWDRGERMIDLRNLSRIGGWATYSGWRSWVAALERDGGNVPLALADLQKNLGRNPGLTIKLLWNRYINNDLGLEKKKFLEDYGKRTQGAGWRHGDKEKSAEALKAWKEKEKELTAKEKGGTAKNRIQWEEEDIKTWENSAKRIPHVILRVLTDDANKIMSKAEAKALLREIFEGVSDDDLKKIYTQTETDLTLAKERVMKRRRDFREQNSKAEFPEEKDEISQEDLISVISNTAEDGDVSKRIDRALKLKKVVEARMRNGELQRRLFDKMKSREFAYALTTEDTPLGEFRFVQTGARGLITRRNNDFLQEVQANGAVEELLKSFNVYQSPDQVVEQLFKIFKFSEVHDYDRALELIEFLAKGIIRMNSIDGQYKFPILGEITSMADRLFKKRGKSYSQTAYGPTAMAWDSDDIYAFTEHLRKTIFIGEQGREVLDRIRKETGGTLWNAIGKKSKVMIYLFMLFASYEMLEKLIKGK